MTSLRQIEANRRNALKSTGPTTPEGKERSSCNAVRHGLTAETVIAVLESSEDYETFEATVISDYNAETAVERQLVLRLASVLWRLRRATSMETAIFDSATENARLLVSVAQSRRVPSIQRPQWPTAICSFQQCRVSHSTALVAMNSLCGGKLARLFPHSSCCGGKNASQGALAFPSHFVVGARVRSSTEPDSGLFLAERTRNVDRCLHSVSSS